jgi:hypothetical protein
MTSTTQPIALNHFSNVMMLSLHSKNVCSYYIQNMRSYTTGFLWLFLTRFGRGLVAGKSEKEHMSVHVQLVKDRPQVEKVKSGFQGAVYFDNTGLVKIPEEIRNDPTEEVCC